MKIINLPFKIHKYTKKKTKKWPCRFAEKVHLHSMKLYETECCNYQLGNCKKMNIISTDRLIWLFWGWYRYIGHSWTDIQHRYFQNFLILFSALLSKIYCILCLTLSSKTSKIRIYEQNFFKLQKFQYVAIIFN